MVSLGAAGAQLQGCPCTPKPFCLPSALASSGRWRGQRRRNGRTKATFQSACPVFEKKRSTAGLTSTEKPPRSTQTCFKSLLVTCPKASRKKAKNYPLNAVEQEASTWRVWRFPLQILPGLSRVWRGIPESPAQHGRAPGSAAGCRRWRRERPSLPALPAHLYFVFSK